MFSELFDPVGDERGFGLSLGFKRRIGKLIVDRFGDAKLRHLENPVAARTSRCCLSCAQAFFPGKDHIETRIGFHRPGGRLPW